MAATRKSEQDESEPILIKGVETVIQIKGVDTNTLRLFEPGVETQLKYWILERVCV